MTESILNAIEYLENIYDLLALCCEILIELKPDYDYHSGKFCEYQKEAGIILYEYMKNCTEKCEKAAIKKIKWDLKRYLGINNNFDKIYAIVLEIDNRIPPVIADSFTDKSDFKKYVCLNQQYSDTIRVIPKRIRGLLDKATQESVFRRPRENGELGLEDMVKNYCILWKKEDITSKPVSIYRASQNSVIYDHFVNEKTITIGVFSVTDIDINQLYEIPCENGKFEVHEMFDEVKSAMQERYQQILNGFHGKKIDFMIFPEMLMTNSILKDVKELEQKNKVAYISVNGTIWKDCTNKAVITDIFGREIATYYKKTSYEYSNKKDGKKYWEHLISPQEDDYVVLEIDGYGRIGIAICKDILNPQVRRIYKKIFANMLIVPAYSSSLDLQSEAKSLSEQIGCIIVFANACSERKECQDVGFLCLPAKLSNGERASIVKKIDKKDCSIKCEQQCLGKCYSIFLFEFEKGTDCKLSYKISIDNCL